MLNHLHLIATATDMASFVRDKRPELFKKRVYNLRGLDGYRFWVAGL